MKKFLLITSLALVAHYARAENETPVDVQIWRNITNKILKSQPEGENKKIKEALGAYAKAYAQELHKSLTKEEKEKLVQYLKQGEKVLVLAAKFIETCGSLDIDDVDTSKVEGQWLALGLAAEFTILSTLSEPLLAGIKIANEDLNHLDKECKKILITKCKQEIEELVPFLQSVTKELEA
ncbi:MAG: hypothetical protein Q8Q25_02090 [bacterium]|nr:hypothetical protein [bacterium]